MTTITPAQKSYLADLLAEEFAPENAITPAIIEANTAHLTAYICDNWDRVYGDMAAAKVTAAGGTEEEAAKAFRAEFARLDAIDEADWDTAITQFQATAREYMAYELDRRNALEGIDIDVLTKQEASQMIDFLQHRATVLVSNYQQMPGRFAQDGLNAWAITTA